MLWVLLMSAYLVDRELIDGLVSAALASRFGDRLRFRHGGEVYAVELAGSAFEGVRTHRALVMGASEFGASLWWENVVSCAARYPNDASGDRPGPCGLTDEAVLAYSYRVVAGAPSPPALLAMLGEYEYQSCEHDGWESSLAFAACDALRRRACYSLADDGAARAWVDALQRRRERWGATAL